MPLVGWVAMTVVALVSILNVTTANTVQQQGLVEEPVEAPVVLEETIIPEEPTPEPSPTPESVAETPTPEEPVYVPAPKPEPIAAPKPEPVPARESSCHPSYSGCLNPNASDYDCAGGSGNGPYYTGPVRVLGPDVFDLDRDGDGMACE